MTKYKGSEIIYHVLMHHINHYQEVKKLFQIDYDSHMILITTYSHLLYEVLNPSYQKKDNEALDWNETFPIIKNLSHKEKKYKAKLSIYSISRILSIPRESVRRKVMFLCKKKYLDYSIKRGLSLGENFEPVAKKIAPKDLSALSKVIKKVDETGGVQNLKRIR